MRTIYLVYVGPRAKDKHLFHRIDSLDINDGRAMDLDAEVSVYAKDMGCYIGAIKEVQDKGDEGITYKKSGGIVGYWKNQDDRTKWQAKKRAYDSAASELKEAKRDLFRDALEPIRDAYATLPYQQRRALLNEVVRIITGG
jgi:hypothetical protein